ncbi:hypothetical protein Cs308_0066 [Candidatus Chlamydia sanziniae]|uniref:Uncharacterized protein n=1 Tax=Candidatus Chlamydia sanziniae TaxID=1806891 RepID=A0A1A9HVV0_9CHLA|nr:hypothetical protein Cs308_0066 [Candidatus Chlamydia sanziniae]
MPIAMEIIPFNTFFSKFYLRISRFAIRIAIADKKLILSESFM